MTPSSPAAQLTSSIVVLAMVALVAAGMARFLFAQLLGEKGASHLSALLLRDLIVLPFTLLASLTRWVLGFFIRR